jgi:molybdopterin-binding protein
VGDFPTFQSLAIEAARLAAEADLPPAAGFLMQQPSWAPFAFIDLCEASVLGKLKLEMLCRQIQQREWSFCSSTRIARRCRRGWILPRPPTGDVFMKIGARNQLVGEVVEIKRGAVMGEVKLTIPACSPMASVMTLESIDDLGIKKGDKVRVIVKAVNVLLLKE